MSFKEVKLSDSDIERIREAEAKLLEVITDITEEWHEKLELSWMMASALNADLLMMAVADLLSKYVKIRTHTALEIWKREKR